MGVVLEKNSYKLFLKNVLHLSIESIMVSYFIYPPLYVFYKELKN